MEISSGDHPAGSPLPLTLVCSLLPVGRILKLQLGSRPAAPGILTIGVTQQAIIFSGGLWKTPACETEVNVIDNDPEAHLEIVKIVEEHARTAAEVPPVAHLP